MNKKYLFIIILAMALSHRAQATGNVMFEQANALYHSKNYDSAASLYTQLVQNGYSSSDLYYNMGNAFYKAGKVGWSIWSYRKSMQLHCTKNVLDNYRLAKKQIKNPLLEQKEIFFIQWWRSLYSLFSVNTWAMIALITFLLFMTSMYLRWIRHKRIPKPLRAGLLVVSVLSIFLMFIRYYNKINHYEAVVVERTFFESSQSAEKERIPEGSEISIVDIEPENRPDEILVKLSDLRQGYIDRKAMKRL